jgi:hypothetical protein
MITQQTHPGHSACSNPEGAATDSGGNPRPPSLAGDVLFDRCASPIRVRKVPEPATRLVRAGEPEPIGASTL